LWFLNRRMSNKECRTRKLKSQANTGEQHPFDLRPSSFVVPCSTFCGSKRYGFPRIADRSYTRPSAFGLPPSTFRAASILPLGTTHRSAPTIHMAMHRHVAAIHQLVQRVEVKDLVIFDGRMNIHITQKKFVQRSWTKTSPNILAAIRSAFRPAINDTIGIV